MGGAWPIPPTAPVTRWPRCSDAGHTPIIKPWPLRPAVEGGFTIDDFTVIEPTDDRPGSVTCPNGVTRPITPARNVTFGAACRGCPLRARCTTNKTGRP